MFTLKILSGPLYGSDITLAASNTFFVVGDRAIDAGANGVADASTAPLAPSEHTLYLPLAESSPNFTMHLAQLRQASAGDLQTRDGVAKPESSTETDGLENVMRVPLTIFDVDGMIEGDISFGRPHQIGALWVAVKAYDSPWSEAVVRFLREGSTVFIRAQADLQNGTQNGTQGDSPRTLEESGAQHQAMRPASSFSRLLTSGRGRTFVALFSVTTLVALVAIAAAAINAGRLSDKPSKLASLPSPALMQLTLNNTDAVVLPGRDDQIFLLVGHDRIESWGRLLQRKGLHASNVSVRGLAQELQRANDVLDRAHIRYWVIRLDDPTHPHVLVQAGIPDNEKARINDLLIAHLPYVRQVAIEEVDPEAVIAEAEHRLKVSGIEYHIEHFVDRASIVIAGALDDQQLRRIDQEARHFKNLWGDRFIQFSVQLAERRAGGIIKQQGPVLIRYQQDHVGFSG